MDLDSHAGTVVSPSIPCTKFSRKMLATDHRNRGQWQISAVKYKNLVLLPPNKRPRSGRE